MMINYYSYEELANNLKKEETKENILNLIEWLKKYGDDSWNGEKWDISDIYGKPSGYASLKPIYEEIDGYFEVVDGEII